MRPSHHGLKRSPVLLFLMLLLVSTALWGCSGKADDTPGTSTSQISNGPPSATILQDDLEDINPFVMWDDYQTDPTSAAARYEGKVFHFPGIYVDQMSYLGEGMDLEFYIQAGMVKFRTDRPENIVMVKAGYTVDIVGKVTGLNWNYLNVWMSSISVTDPPGGGSWSEY